MRPYSSTSDATDPATRAAPEIAAMVTVSALSRSRLRYRLTGPALAPVLVLSGSLGTTMEMWQPQLADLSARFRVLRFDHCGHGGSAVPAGPYRIDRIGAAVLDLLDELAIDRVHYAGLSLGGMLGMWLAGTAPDRVRRLALLSTSAYLPPAAGWLDRAAQVRAAGTASVATMVMARWFTEEYRQSRPSVVASYAAMLGDTPAEGYAGCCEAIAAMDLRPLLPGITAVTLLIGGDRDPATPIEHAHAIAVRVPHASVMMIPAAAHLVNVEHPGQVGHLLRLFFAADHVEAGA
jgi:3-oxoadipate enol-lactonase